MAETLVKVSSMALCCEPRTAAPGVRFGVSGFGAASPARRLHSYVGLRAQQQQRCWTSRVCSASSKCGDGRATSRQAKSSLLRVRCGQLADASTAASADAKPVASKLVLVLGATGGVGQLLVASLLEKGVKVRALIRSPEKAESLFGKQLGDQLEFQIGDTRRAEVFTKSIFEGVTHVINATGTTAFPSPRWKGDNGPEQTDWIGVRNLVDALPKSVQRVVLVSSIGVSKPDSLPWIILNLFGVLKYKKMGEDYLKKSGIPFTIIRSGRLTDGPYTSYDFQTLLKATSGTRRAVTLGQGDKLVGDASRIVVAEACVNALDLECAEGQTYELVSVEGEGPGRDAEKWASLFEAVHLPSA